MVCPWITDLERPVCACATCEWDTATDAQKQAAIDWATTILWASTGRQFGLCPVTVRPCGWRDCAGGVEWFGAMWQGSSWIPYIWDGTWYNAWCGCDGACCCIPDCSVRLEGPIHSITAVTIDGVLVDPATYFVYDYQWLTRVKDNGCWPFCSDLNVAPGEGWEVSYIRGREVPAPLLWAVGVLACQYIKLCQNAEGCRITNNRIISMSRQGADYQFVNFSELLEFGWTGVAEVDQLIAAYNPYGLKAPLLVLSPELRYPRQVTWP
jgi:hypothetical protein